MKVHRFPKRMKAPSPLAVLCIAAAAVGSVALVTGSQMAVYGQEPGPAAASPTPLPDSGASGSPEKLGPISSVPERIGNELDGLTDDELAYARALVGETIDFAAGRDVDGQSGAQFVDATVDTTVRDGDRRLTLTYYDYATSSSLGWSVNVTTGEIGVPVSSTALRPSVSAREAEVAYEQLVLSKQASAIGAAYLAATGETLTSSTQTMNMARVYVPAVPGTPAQPCQVNRCVILVTQVPSGPFLPTDDFVVDLTAHTVYEAI